MSPSHVLERLEAGLHGVGALGRETFEVGPFRAYLAASSAYLMSFAVPYGPDAHLPDPTSRDDAIVALRDLFASRGRRARLEFFAELHPDLADALTSHGFVQDAEARVMTLGPAGRRRATDLRSQRRPGANAAYRRLRADDRPFLTTFLERQDLAYGGSGQEGALAWLPQLEFGLRDGSVIGAALMEDGQIVSGGIVQAREGVGELAGVWTLPSRQRSGLAYASCASLLHDAVAEGLELIWLSAGEGAERLYEKLGFEPVGTQLNYGLPV